MNCSPWTLFRWAGFSVLLSWGGMSSPRALLAQTYLDNQTLYLNQDPNTETRRSDHIRVCFGHFNRDTSVPMTEQLAQGNLVMYEQMWNRWVIELGLHDINVSATTPDGNKYRANFNFLMTWNDGGGGGAYSSMDANGFFYAMANTTYCRYDPPSGATPHEFGHVWQGTGAGFNGTDSSGAWWEEDANWMLLQFLNTYPQAAGYIQNGVYFPAHGRDYYDSWPIWEAAREDPRYGPAWVNNVWTNANPTQRVSEFIVDRMIRLDSSGSADRAGAINDLWGNLAKKLVTWDFERQEWLATANSADDGSDWYFYQRCRTPLVAMPGTNGWYRPARAHLPLEFGFNLIPLAATPGTTVTCNFQPQSDPLRQSDWRACLVAVSTNLISPINPNGYASYSSLWNLGANSMTLSADQTKLYLVVIATPRPQKLRNSDWQAYLTEAGLQFPYAVSFTNAAPRNVSYPVQSHTGMTQHPNGGGWKANTAVVDATAYLGPNAQVLGSAQLRGYARLEDYAVLRDSAQVRDYAVVSGHAVVQDTAQVYANAKVRDWARVFGNAQVYGNARVIEHANCGDSGNLVFGNAVLKGTTYVYSPSTFSGSLICDGDTANGGTGDHGVHFGWQWGQNPSIFSGLTDNHYQYCGLTFENTELGITNNPVFAADEFGINHGFLMNGCRSTIDAGATPRGGYVLALNGTNQYVELHNSVNDFKDTTVALWFKATGGVSDQRLWSFGNGSNKAMYLTPHDAGSGGLRLVISNALTGTVVDGGVIPTNVWTHAAVVFSGSASNCTLYVNGLPVASQSGLTLFPESLNAPLMENANYLGRGNAGNFFQGSVDDFRVFMRSLSAAEVAALYATPAPALVTPVADSPPPTPTWLVAPAALNDNALTMSIAPTNSALGWSEYYFQCIVGGGHDSGWVSFNKYTDVGLAPGTAYTYTVRMRDQSGNLTGASVPGTATTPISSSGTASFAYGPIGIANGQITMTAATLTNASGKAEYKFDRSGKSSGWLGSPAWTDTGLSTGAFYNYTVTARDGRGNTSAPSAALKAFAVDNAAPLLPVPVAHWVMQPYATITNSISMTAQTATDPSGVQYWFHCVSGGGPDSGWQSSSTFVTPVLADGAYAYQYQLRDLSPQNNTNPSPATTYTATIKPTTGYHTYTLSQVVTNPDDYLVSFPATVIRVNPSSYSVKDLVSGAAITVEPNTSNLVTVAGLALKNVTVQGHLYTRSGSRIVTYAAVASNGIPVLFAISGKVTNSLGAGISGATVYFSDGPNASSNSVASTITDASGNYSKGVTPGTWYVAAGAGAFNTSADSLVVVANSAVAGVNLGLVSNAVIRGLVTHWTGGTIAPGASVFFSRLPGASGHPVFTAAAAADGTYAQPLQNGTWYLAAGGAGFYPTPDLVVTVAGTDLANINFAVKSNVRNIPQPGLIYFSAVTDSLPPAGQLAGSWPAYLPAGQSLSPIGSPTTALLGGVKWEQNHRITSNDGFLVCDYSANPAPSIACHGVTILAAAAPVYCSPGGENRGEIVDILYDRLALAISHPDGRLIVAENGNWGIYGPALANNTPVILSLVVQPDGSFVCYTNGVAALTHGANGDFSNALTPTDTVNVFKRYVNLGRNNPDGWSAFNGYLGDVFVYTNALVNADRQQLEADLTARFISVGYQIAASANTGGTLNPSGTVYVAPGGTQTFTISPSAGNFLTSVVVDGVSLSATNRFTFTNVVANHTLAVTFAALAVPPILTITPNSTGGLDLTWPDSYTGQLLSSATLGASATWAVAGATPVHVGSLYKATVTPVGYATFYRLGPGSPP